MTQDTPLLVPVSSQGEWTAKRFFGDPKLAAAYLPVAYALLGVVKNRMALGGVGYGSQMLNLPDGTRIRVLRNGDQNVVEITVGAGVTSEQVPIGSVPHGFCFHPKTNRNLDGWLYVNEQVVVNPSTFLFAYYFEQFRQDCFGTVWYTKVYRDDVRKIIKKYTVLFGTNKLSGNQFFHSGENVYSFFHSAGGDLPMLKEKNMFDIYRSLFVPFLRTYAYNSDALWTPLPDFPIPKVVYRNGAIYKTFNEYVIGVGVHQESGYEFVLLTFQFRNFTFVTIDGKTIYEETIYQRNTQAGFVLDRKAFVSPDGTQFSLISIHPNGSKIHRYSVTVNKDGEFEVIKTGTTTMPPASEQLKVTYTSEYTGESYRTGDFLTWPILPGEDGYNNFGQTMSIWLLLNKPENVGDCLYLRGRTELPPPAETRTAEGSIQSTSEYSKTSKEPVAVLYDGDQDRVVTFDYAYHSTATREYQESSEFNYYYIFYSTFYPWIDCGGTQYRWQGEKTCATEEENHEVITFEASFNGGEEPFIVASSNYTMDETGTGAFHEFPDMDVGGRGQSRENSMQSTYRRVRNEFEYIIDYFNFTHMAYIGMRYDRAHWVNSDFTYTYFWYQRKPNVYQFDVIESSYDKQRNQYEAKFKETDILYENEVEEVVDEHLVEPNEQGIVVGYFLFPVPDRAFAAGNQDTSASSGNDLQPTFLDGVTRNVTGAVSAAFDDRYTSSSGKNPYIYTIKFSAPQYPNGFGFFHGDSFSDVVKKLPVNPDMLHVVGLW
jgi:hypothetical protein